MLMDYVIETCKNQKPTAMEKKPTSIIANLEFMAEALGDENTDSIGNDLLTSNVL